MQKESEFSSYLFLYGGKKPDHIEGKQIKLLRADFSKLLEITALLTKGHDQITLKKISNILGLAFDPSIDNYETFLAQFSKSFGGFDKFDRIFKIDESAQELSNDLYWPILYPDNRSTQPNFLHPNHYLELKQIPSQIYTFLQNLLSCGTFYQMVNRDEDVLYNSSTYANFLYTFSSDPIFKTHFESALCQLLADSMDSSIPQVASSASDYNHYRRLFQYFPNIATLLIGLELNQVILTPAQRQIRSLIKKYVAPTVRPLTAEEEYGKEYHTFPDQKKQKIQIDLINNPFPIAHLAELPSTVLLEIINYFHDTFNNHPLLELDQSKDLSRINILIGALEVLVCCAKNSNFSLAIPTLKQLSKRSDIQWIRPMWRMPNAEARVDLRTLIARALIAVSQK